MRLNKFIMVNTVQRPVQSVWWKQKINILNMLQIKFVDLPLVLLLLTLNSFNINPRFSMQHDILLILENYLHTGNFIGKHFLPGTCFSRTAKKT